jgi:hypothetical protein
VASRSAPNRSAAPLLLLNPLQQLHRRRSLVMKQRARMGMKGRRKGI